MNNPLVSIILSTYNWNSKWLTESINSVLNQSYAIFELIIINDASINDIEETILEFQKKNNRIIYIKNEKNLWLTKSLNKWIELAKWKYIARIDDDDIWYDEDKLKKQVNFMEQNPDYWLCGTWIILIDENWKEIDKVLNRWWDENIKKYISGSNQFAHSSIIIRKSILDKVWWYIDNNITKYTEDYDLWLRIWTVSKFHNLQEYCLKYMVRNWSISWKKGFKQKVNAFKVYLQYKNYYPNKISWIIKHLITIFFPTFIIKSLLKKFIKKIRNLLK